MKIKFTKGKRAKRDTLKTINSILIALILLFTILHVTTLTKTETTALMQQTKLLSANNMCTIEPSFTKKTVKAGETVVLKISIKDIKTEMKGINNIVGFLKYDENLVDLISFEGATNSTQNSNLLDWNLVFNQDENNARYQKFCAYTLNEGAIQNQDVAVVTLKVKEDVTETTTLVKFVELQFSDMENLYGTDDIIVELDIIDSEDDNNNNKPGTDEDSGAEEDDDKEDNKEDNPDDSNSSPVQTGDTYTIIIIICLILLLTINILLNKKIRSKLNKKIIITIAIILLGIIALTISVLAMSEENAHKLEHLPPSITLLNSDKYLVTDEYVKFVNPETTYETFIQQLNKHTHICKENGEEIIEGLITTGMKVALHDEGSLYLISVTGDINGDAHCNSIDLTSTIRGSLNIPEYKLIDAKREAADIDCNYIINEKDIEPIVNYIVFGTMQTPNFDKVEKPTLEVVKGNYDETEKVYTEEIQIKITNTSNTAVSSVYKIESGEYFEEFINLPENNIITISPNGPHKISTYSYGIMGNRSEVVEMYVVKEAKGIVNLEAQGWEYGEDAITPEITSTTNSLDNITITYEGTTKDGTQYGPTSEPPTEIGDYTVTVIVPENECYEEVTETKDFSITVKKLNLEEAQVTLPSEEIIYDGQEKEPPFTIVVDGTTLEEGKDFTVEYKDNTDPGTGTIVIIGQGNYEGTIEVPFEIQKAKLTVTTEISEITFGETPSVTVKVEGFVNGDTPATATGYAAPYVDNLPTSAGTYTIYAQGGQADKYEFDYQPANFVINPKQATDANTQITVEFDKTSYTGQEQKPGITMVVDGVTLVEGQDFEVEYIDNVNAGTSTVVIKGKGNYEGEFERTFEIEKVELTATYVSEEIQYNTTASLVVKVEGFVNNETPETALNYKAPIVENTYTATGTYELTPKNGEAANYTFEYVSGTLTIISKVLSTQDAQITINPEDIKYTGQPQTPEAIIVVDGRTLIEGQDFTIEYKDNVDPGTATVIITGKGEYEGTIETSFEIQKAVLTATYVGEEIIYGGTPKLEIKVEGFVNSETESTAQGYTAPNLTNTNTAVGTYTLTPEGGTADKYTFNYVSGELVIKPIELTNANTQVSLEYISVDYNGTAHTPGVEVVYDGQTLTEGVDYTVEYVDNTNAGTATVKIIGIGTYSGTVEENFVINKLTLTATYSGETAFYGETPDYTILVEGFINGENEENALGYKKPEITHEIRDVGIYELTPINGEATNYNFDYKSGELNVIVKTISINDAIISFEEVHYTGLEVEPKVTIEINGQILVEGTDFDIVYGNNINVGTATAQIIGKENYAGTIDTTFEILKAILYVIYEGETISYGETPQLTLKINGFVTNETPESAAGFVKPTLTNTNTAIGTYVLTPEGGQADNYEFQYVSGTLEITPMDLTKVGAQVTLSETTFKYNGNAHTPEATVVIGEKTLVEGVDYTVEYIENTNAGTATVKITGIGVYGGTIETTFEIQKAMLTVSYVGEIINYQEIPSLVVTVTGFIDGEDTSNALGYVAPQIINVPTAVGTYDITPQGGSATNYEFTYIPGTLVIEAHVPYTVKHFTQNYDGSYSLNKTETPVGPKNRTVTASEISINGYEFDSANANNKLSGTCLADGGLVLELYYNPIVYTINYVLNGGVVAGQNPSTYTIVTPNITLINPSKELNTFTGWTSEGVQTPQTSMVIETGSTGNKEFVANWNEYTYKIKFNGNGATSGTMADITNIKYSETKTLTTNAFIRTECNFIGWNTVADGSGKSFTNAQEISQLTTQNNGVVTLYAQWKDVVLPKWTAQVTSNTNTDYPEYASSSHTITVKITGSDANYLSNSLNTDNLEIYVGALKAVVTSKSLSTPTTTANGVEYTLTLSGIQGDGALSIILPENTITDKWQNGNTEYTYSCGITVDNTAPNAPQIALTGNGGLYSSDYYYQTSATYTITSGTDNVAAVAASIMSEGVDNGGISVLASTDSIAKTTYTVTGAVTVEETKYSLPVNVAPASTRGSCVIGAVTEDKAGNKSAKATKSNNICGSHDKGLNSQVSAATCTAAEKRQYHCTYCHMDNGTYTGAAKLGHYYPCSGSNHKKNGGSVSITCSRCTTKKTYSVTNGTCTSWECSCGASGGTSTHASGTYSYADSTYHSYKCSRCSGTISAKHTHSSWSVTGSSGHYHYCGTCKHTYGSIISHSMGWKSTSTTHGWTCGTCGYTSSSGSHSFTSYSGYKKCDICGYTTGT